MSERYGLYTESRVLLVHRSVLYYYCIKDDQAIEEALLKKAEECPGGGFWEAY